jgi:YVTN family beta-propeller protein
VRSFLILLVTAVLFSGSPAAAATLLVTNTKSDSVSVIDTNTFEVVATIPVGKGKPNRIVFHPEGRWAWVVYDKTHDLGVIDAEARKLVKRVKIGGNPYNLNFTPDGRHLLVLDWSSDTSNDEVIFYDLQAEKIDGRVEVSTWPAHSVFSRDARRLYVSGETAGDLTVIDVATRTAAATPWAWPSPPTARCSTPPPGRTRPSSRSIPRPTSPWARSPCPASSTSPP